jgi:hypothetical protein
MSGMSMNREGGYVNPLLISLILSIVVLLGVAGFGAWAYSSRQDYKNNSDLKSAAAASEAVKKTQIEEAAKYAEQAKSPLQQYVGPSQYGAVTVQYPKTWSGYIISNASNPLSTYFHPDVVPDIVGGKNAYAMRIQVIPRSYASQMQQYETSVNAKKITVTPYTLPKVPDVVGSRIDGQISADNQGSIVVLPLRNMTLMISTESQDFIKDFNEIILPNATFAP